MRVIRQRYILFEILTPENQPLEKEMVIKALWKQLLDFYGEANTFHVGLWLIRYDPIHRIGILRCDHIAKLQVLAAMCLIREINKIPVIIHSRKTRGTIKKTLEQWRQFFPTITPPPREKQ